LLNEMYTAEEPASIVWSNREGAAQDPKRLQFRDITAGSAYVKLSLNILREVTGASVKDDGLKTQVVQLKEALLKVFKELHGDEAYKSMRFKGEVVVTTDAALERGAMMFVGGSNTGTGFHVDWSNACNLAFNLARGTAPPVIGQTLLAYWVFIKPTTESLEAVSNWLQHNVKGYTSGLKYPNYMDRHGDVASLPTLSTDDIKLLQGAEELQGHILVKAQRHGCLMNAPVGWPHSVTNVIPNLKIAFDFVKEADLPKIALSHVYNIVPFFRQYSPADYTSCIHKAFPHLVAHVNMLRHMPLLKRDRLPTQKQSAGG
jgi:hypothetical protein